MGLALAIACAYLFDTAFVDNYLLASTARLYFVYISLQIVYTMYTKLYTSCIQLAIGSKDG